jgi:hypothetical protein
MVDDLALDAVISASHVARQRIGSIPIVGLAGDVQQRLGRGSHEIELRAVIVGPNARDALTKLQQKATAGEEATFTADIATALELTKVVILIAEFAETAGRPDRYEVRLVLRESPPLPPPAEVEPFGGLDGLDLGFDTDVLGDIAELAGDVQKAVETVSNAVAAIEKLSSLANLAVGNPLEALHSEAGKMGNVAGSAARATEAIAALFGGR